MFVALFQIQYIQYWLLILIPSLSVVVVIIIFSFSILGWLLIWLTFYLFFFYLIPFVHSVDYSLILVTCAPCNFISTLHNFDASHSHTYKYSVVFSPTIILALYLSLLFHHIFDMQIVVVHFRMLQYIQCVYIICLNGFQKKSRKNTQNIKQKRNNFSYFHNWK